VADAALAVGFFDQSHFTNRVRQTYGMTPRTFQLGWGGA
jgi:AraC-like DNA-binding protein